MTGTPKDLLQQIDKMFVISVDIKQNAAPGGPEVKPEKSMRCEAPLIGTGYSVKHP